MDGGTCKTLSPGLNDMGYVPTRIKAFMRVALKRERERREREEREREREREIER